MAFKNEKIRTVLIIGLLATGATDGVYAKAEKQSYPLEVKFKEKPYEEVVNLYDRMYKRDYSDMSEGDKKLYQEHEATEKFYVAKYDLNDDGIEEVFTNHANSLFCGSAGCPVEIYQKNKAGKWISILSKPNSGVSAYKRIEILENKTKGYHDIILSLSIWKWDGEYYEFYQKIK